MAGDKKDEFPSAPGHPTGGYAPAWSLKTIDGVVPFLKGRMGRNLRCFGEK